MTNSTAPGNPASTARLLRVGTVLTSDRRVPDLLRGDVHIRDGRIDAVGEKLPVGPDVEIVDASGTIVFPGLVDAHQHVWEGPFLLEFAEMGIGSYFDEFHQQAVPGRHPGMVA
jgi:cytosine/adenosine deaminase-related metal-dependent hydrolase